MIDVTRVLNENGMPNFYREYLPVESRWYIDGQPVTEAEAMAAIQHIKAGRMRHEPGL